MLIAGVFRFSGYPVLKDNEAVSNKAIPPEQCGYPQKACKKTA
jgi:hypothetical protein